MKTFKQNANIGIVGGGIIGAFAAFYLLQKGHRVTIFEQFGEVFRGTTSAGFGSLTPFSDPFFKGGISSFAAKSVRLYREEVLPLLEPETVFLSEDSLLHLIKDEEEQLRYTAELAIDKYRILSPADVRRLEPNLTGDIYSSIEYFEPWIDVAALLPALKCHLAAHGNCEFRCGATITSIEERVGQVELIQDNNQKSTFDFAIIATGASLARIAGIPTPKIKLVRGDGALAMSESRKPLVSRHVYMGKAFITPRLDGGHLLGATYENLHNPPIDSAERATARAGHLAEILTGAIRLLPALEECEVSRIWHGWRPSTPQGLPYVGLVSGCQMTWAALGFIGLGLTLAPAVGKGIAESISGLESCLPEELTAQQDSLWDAQ